MANRSWMQRAIVFWPLVVVWAALLWWLSSQPGSGRLPLIPHFDKVLHTVYFLCGGVVFQLAMRASAPSLSPRLLLVIGLLFAALIGALDEYHQTFTPGRTGNDVFDWLADCLGGTLAAYLVNRWHTSASSNT
jgi:VanZ family protein